MTNRIELMDNYLNKELSKQEECDFEERLFNDETFAKEFSEFKKLDKNLRRYNERKNVMNEFEKIHAEIIVKDSPFWKKYVSGFSLKTLAMAASVAAITSISILLFGINYKSTSTNRAYYKELRRDIDKIKQSNNKIWKELYNDRKITNFGTYAGTGFALSSNGYVITSYHLVKESDSVFIENDKFSRHKVKIVYSNKENDISILKVSDSDFESFGKLPYTFDSNYRQLGTKIFTLGFPREDIVYGEGYISSGTGYDGDTSSYQVSIPLNPGNSGGPIIDDKSCIIGVVSGKHSENEGTAFALKINYLQKSIETLKKDSSISINNTVSNRVKNKRTDQITKIENCIFRVRVYK